MRLILDENLLVAAGAGSGKTHALCSVALGLYGGAGGRAPLDPQSVWAVTFTERAAAELVERLTRRVRGLARGGPDDARELFGPDDPGSRPERWSEVARALGGAPVGTFHALCAALLRRHAAEAGIDPRFAILDEHAAERLRARVRDEVLLASLGDAGSAARTAARALGGLHALRGALEAIEAKLVEEGIEPAALVAPRAFDPAAARVALEGACLALPSALAGLAASRSPRLEPARVAIAREQARLGRLDPPTLARWYGPLGRVVAAPRGRGSLPGDARAAWSPVAAAWDALRGALAACGQAEAGRALAELAGAVRSRYAAEKRAISSLDFGDLIARSRELLASDHAVRREAKARVEALLVDEFQDVNRLQLDLVHLLGEARGEERPLPPGARASSLPLAPGVVCLVGDRKQSIYDFRGADVSVLGEVAARARAGAGFRIEALDRSYRARPALVELANRLFQRVLDDGSDEAERPFGNRWRPEEDALTAIRDDRALDGLPAVELLEGAADRAADARRPEESELVARRIVELIASRRLVEPRGEPARPVRGGDVAILLRTFRALELYRGALSRLGVPSVVTGGRGFHNAREVRDFAALLAALADPFDRFASAAVLRSPWVGLSDDAIALLALRDQLALGRHARGAAEGELSPDDRARLDRFGPLAARLSREVDRLGPAGVLELAAAELDLFAQLAASTDGEQRVANARKLLARLATARAASALETAQALLTAADDEGDREPAAELAAADTRAVRISTVHAAKGLEFPVVVVPELGSADRTETGVVLFDRSRGLAVRTLDLRGDRIADAHAESVASSLQARREAESARLFYVAVTRARDLLILCGEHGKKPHPGAWRSLLDVALPALAPLVHRVALPAGGPAPVLPPAPAPAGDAALSAAAVLERSRPPRVAPGRFIAAVTDLSVLARCERRYFYRAVVGLEEHAALGASSVEPLEDAGEGGDPDETEAPTVETPALDRMARGTLAHLLLERADLALARVDPRRAVLAAARAEGLDLDSDEVRAIADDAAALLASPLGRALCDPATPHVERELPFALSVRGASGAELVLKGQIDLLFVDGDGALHVVDYKHAAGAREPADPLAGSYAFQLRTYALAARRVSADGVALRVGIAWLRDRGRPARFAAVAADDLAAHEAALAALADRLAAATAARRFAKLPARSACGDCGYQLRCWGRVPAEQLALFPTDQLTDPPPSVRRRKRR